MTGVNWNLLDRGGGLAQFGYGAQMGQNLRERTDANNLREATAGYLNNPTPEGLAAVTNRNPEAGQRLRQDAEQRAEAQRTRQQEQVRNVARLFEGVTAENYPQRIAAAQQMGIDTSGIPQQFDPNWVASNKAIFDAFLRPDGQQRLTEMARDVMLSNGISDPADPRLPALMTAALQQKNTRVWTINPGGSALQQNPDGTYSYIVAPEGFPAAQQAPPQAPPAAAIARLRANPGEAALFDRAFGPGAAARVLGNGGPASPAPGNFPVSPAP